MNSLLVYSLIGAAAVGQNPTQGGNHTTGVTTATTIQQKGKLNLLGPHMHGTPRILGIKGVRTIPAKNYKIKDFQDSIARDGTTVAQNSGIMKRMTGTPTALVMYDKNGDYGWIGSLYAYQIGNLLTHFGVTVTRKGIEAYNAGDLAAYDSAYYLGTTYYNPIPKVFKTEFLANTKPFCWMGYNLWEVAWTADGSAWNAAFTNKFGFQFAYLDGTGFPNIKYKNSTLTKQQDDPTQGDTMITNPSIASAVAVSTNGTTTVPYITKGANLWYVGDNPLEYVAYNRGDDRMLAFSDMLNDTTNIAEPLDKRAVLRIEDVSAICDTASLRGIADTLAAAGIPYVVCVIPDYKDPLGIYNNGVGQEIQVQNNARFTADLKYMVSKGAQLIMHGVSHQYSNVANPVNGVSATDVEFFRVTTDSNGNQVDVGPVAEDSTQWVTDRLTSGFNMFASAGLPKPTGWNSPHYYATPTDYKVFAKKFNYSMDRVLTYATDRSGNLQYLIQYAPYVITDEFGNHRIPETLGYFDPNGTNGRVNMPADMIGYANQIQCVRGGWAGMYYHWFLGNANLKTLVDGIKSLGYTFVDPNKTTY